MRIVTSTRRLLTTLLMLVLVSGSLAVTTVSAEAAGRSSYIVLRPGDSGPRVAALQRYLNVRPAGGNYGAKTRRAVVRWQGNHDRRQTGLVGKFLWRAVNGVRTPAPSRAGDRATSLNWRALARCESSGNPRAVNPAGYYGLYQFSPSTWRSVGGRGMPHHASAAEQTGRAQTLFRRSGSGPWPHCGRLLFS